MSTGQYPRRRETDAQAKFRAEAIAERTKALFKDARPLHPIEVALMQPRISSSGRLVSR